MSARHHTVLLASVLIGLLAWLTSASAGASTAELLEDELLSKPTSAQLVQRQPAGRNSLQRGEDPGGTEDRLARQETAALAVEGSGESPVGEEEQQMFEVSADRTGRGGGGRLETEWCG